MRSAGVRPVLYVDSMITDSFQMVLDSSRLAYEPAEAA
jgi:hypothetical protein